MGTTAYTDGACQGNPGPGGWAWAVTGGGPFASGAEAASTNQRMEIWAVLDAVRSLDGPLEVVSDSTYVVHCFRDRWWAGWIQRGWLNKAKKPVANQDLWKPLIELVNGRGDVSFRWVKGHSGDPMNDLVDRLAVEAAASQAGRRGSGDPGPLGPADSPRSSPAAPAPSEPSSRPGPSPASSGLPAGRLLAVSGHQPLGLGGYDPNPVADRVRRRLTELLAAKATLHPDLVVVTGLRLGAEQLAAEAAAAAGVPYVAVLPFPDPDAPWPPARREAFRALLAGATTTVVLDPTAPADRQRAGVALGRRDAWLARHVDEAIVVWDGDDAEVGRLVRSFSDRLGEDEVWVLDPS